jgi:hypothetical protein
MAPRSDNRELADADQSAPGNPNQIVGRVNALNVELRIGSSTMAPGQPITWQ